MPSQEDYLDELLKNMDSGVEEMQPRKDDDLAFPEESGNIDDLAFPEESGNIDDLAFPEESGNLDDLAFPEESGNIDDLAFPEELGNLDDLAFPEELGNLDDLAFPEELPESDGLADEIGGLDDISDMSEDDIMKLLAEGEAGAGEEGFPEEIPQELFAMLQDSGDDELQDIHEMLEKADRDALIEEDELWDEESITDADRKEATPQEMFEFDQPVAENKKEIRKIQAAEKKAEREARKQAKAAARAVAKAEKKAAREAAKAAKAAKATRKASEKAEAPDDIDMSELDFIMEQAENVSLQTEDKTSDDFTDLQKEAAANDDLSDLLGGTAGEDDDLSDLPGGVAAENDNLSDLLGGTAADDDLSNLFGEANAGDGLSDLLGVTEEQGNRDASDFDLGSLFGEPDEDKLLGQTGQSDFADFMDFSGDAGLDDVIREIPEKKTSKKKGIFTKILDFLTEEDPEEAESKGNENIRLSDENKEILEDLDKGKGIGKKKKKKGKKGAKQGGASDGETGESGGKATSKKKPKKGKKPKKEKKSKEPELQSLMPQKKLSLKRVFPIVLIGLSLGIFIIVFTNASADYSDKRTAKKAFYEGDYATCYQNLFGKELNETEQVMYAKSESILYIRLWIREYEMFVQEGDEMRALDSLIQTVDSYPQLYEYASRWNATAEVAAGYSEVLVILKDKYGLTESQAMAIAAEPKDVEYTRMIAAVVDGDGLGLWEEVPPEDAVMNDLKDKLPEEAELGQETFVEGTER